MRLIVFAERPESVHTAAELLGQATQVIIFTSGVPDTTAGAVSCGYLKLGVLARILLAVLVFEDKVPMHGQP
jgi:hypothetical protein